MKTLKSLFNLQERFLELPFFVQIFLSAILSTGIYFTTLKYEKALLENISDSVMWPFQKMPTLKGVYSCCGTEQAPISFVGKVEITCGKPSYFANGGKLARVGTGCSFKELDHQEVTVERSIVPHSGSMPYVTSITSNGKVYFQRADQQLRNEWLATSWSRVNQWPEIIAGIFFIVSTIKLVLITKEKKGS